MPFTPEQTEKITAALKEKVPLPCPSCGNRNWSIAGDLVSFQLQPKPNEIFFGGPTLPCIATICTTCGNTQFYNVFLLGIAEAFGLAAQGAEQRG